INKDFFNSQETFERFKKKIINELRMLRGPNHDEVMFLVSEKQELYQGKYLEDAPDIILVPNVKYALSAKPSSKIFDIIREPILPGTHTSAPALEGIFMVRGPNVKVGYKVSTVNIWDVTPTILHILGLPIPQDMDGRVLRKIFDPSSPIVNKKVKHIDELEVARIMLKKRIKMIRRNIRNDST
ncbi:MAG: hypothetical protein DRP00_02215, partial [Candidatus Aenigmatarchaeota archaeon]